MWNQQPSLCPMCSENTETTIESRKTKEGFVRRRRECSSCKSRRTTYEVSREFYETGCLLLKQHQRTLSILKDIKQVENKNIKCELCVFNQNEQCTFDLPEHNTVDAFDCTYFEKA